MTTLPMIEPAQAAEPVLSIPYTTESASYHWASVGGVKVFIVRPDTKMRRPWCCCMAIRRRRACGIR